MNTSQIATYVLLISSVFWGLLWIPLKALSGMGIDGVFLTFVCYGAMFFVLLSFTFKVTARYLHLYRALLGIFLAGGIANLCFNYAMVYGEVMRVMVLFYLLPVWGVLGGRFILKEKTGMLRWLGVVLAIIGAFILLGGTKIFIQHPNWIDLVALMSGFFFAANIMLFRGVENIPLSVKINALFLGCFVISGILLLLGFEEIKQPLNFPALMWTVAFALTWLMLANLGSQWAATKIPAGRSSILIIMELIAAVLSAVLIGGETITGNIIVGGILVLSATAVEVWTAMREGRQIEGRRD